MQEIAVAISRAVPKIKFGSLRFWGVWFGRPYDNNHRLVACSAEGDALRFTFDEQEELFVSEPRGLVIDERTFRIAAAQRVRWQWFHYGRPRTPENLSYEDFVLHGPVTTNENRGTIGLTPDFSLPAVEIPDLPPNMRLR